MAITQDSMAEEILSRSERAIIRSVYRASKLQEGIIAIDKILATLSESAPMGQTPPSFPHIKEIKRYLQDAISTALVNTKVPAQNPIEKGNPLPRT